MTLKNQFCKLPLLSCFWRLKITDQLLSPAWVKLQDSPIPPTKPTFGTSESAQTVAARCSRRCSNTRSWVTTMPRGMALGGRAGHKRLRAGLTWHQRWELPMKKCMSFLAIWPSFIPSVFKISLFFLRQLKSLWQQKPPAKDTSNGSQSSRRPLSPCPSVTGNPISNLCH